MKAFSDALNSAAERDAELGDRWLLVRSTKAFFDQRFTRVAIAVALVVFLTIGFYPRERWSDGELTPSFSDSWIVDLVQNQYVGLSGDVYYNLPGRTPSPEVRQGKAHRPYLDSLVATWFALMGAVVAVGVAEKMLTEDDLDNDEQAAA